jgi:YYY domain-containing protein
MIEKRAWLYDLLFIVAVLIAAALRFTGVEWGEGYHQHPDELFLSGVLDNLRAHACEDAALTVDACPVDQQRWLTPAEYFDSAKSTLNPYNRGHAFFVYGTLPLFIVRYMAEMTATTDIGELKFFSRQLSALADIFTIFLLYFIAARIYGRRIGWLAGLFSALTVMQIQQSHFFTTDLFTNMFMFLALWFAVEIVHYSKPLTIGSGSGIGDRESENGRANDSRLPNNEFRITNYAVRIVSHPLFLLSIGFGLALGMAMASKINAAAAAILLPGAFIIRYLTVDREPKASKAQDAQSDLPQPEQSDYWLLITLFLIAGGLATIVSFRIFQPYAFQGLGLNPQWVANIAEQRGQATGEADLPWNLQWVRRTHLYSFANLTLWGLGLPLGILAWAGFLLMGWRILKGEWKHALLWGWTAFYFVWQSLQFNPTMRYQLPVYPLLAMMAAWFIFELADWKVGAGKRISLPTILASLLGVTVLSLTAIWAVAFHGIYLRPESRMAASRWIYANVPGPINLQIKAEDGETYNEPLAFPAGGFIQLGIPYTTNIVSKQSGLLTGVTFAHALDTSALPSTVVLSIVSPVDPGNVFARASATVDNAGSTDPRGSSVSFTFDQPVPVDPDTSYMLMIENLGETLTLTGAAFANESDYDWGLPFRIDGYDPFGGIYRGDLNLQVYWDDNDDKLIRFVDTLSQTDYIFVPTNHQYAQITRVPERYPLTTLYYRELLGCPGDEDIIECYRDAQPGQYKGGLGFELAAVFESYPTFGPFVINDQSAEEAFTFYDHPKVLIFKKTADFDVTRVRAVLGSVDLATVIRLTPTQFDSYKELTLPFESLMKQRAGGTWSGMFDYDWIQNKYPFVGLIIWYVFIFALGLVVYPIVRLALPGLGARAYPLSRVLGLALLAWLAWMGGSLGIPYTRLSIGAALTLITVTGLGLWWMRRDQFREEWQSNRKFFLLAEILFLSFFIFDLLVRLGNSDLWHPSKGGERPMDFSYFNAVLKSTSFPPYDPWFAGGYINYYYYGFVLVGTPVKLLGIVPSIAYNFILPTLFAMVACGAFTLGWNLLDGKRGSGNGDQENAESSMIDSRLTAGLAASIMAVLIGNLGTVQMIYQALQRMAAPGGVIVDANIVQKLVWAVKGFFMSFGAAAVPIGQGEWYWNPSRVIPPGPGNEITEFPLFTFLYSDLHAHMIVLPLALFVIAWSVSMVKARAHLTRIEWAVSILMGALILGAVYPTNLSDFYTYLLVALSALVFAFLFRADVSEVKWMGDLPEILRRFILLILSSGALIALTFALYAPYRAAYSQAYGALGTWTGSYTPIWSYLTHWGFFLFIIVTWLAWETRQWMAHTPVSALAKLRPYSLLIEFGLAILVSLLAYFIYKQAPVGLLALPMATWAGILLLRRDLPDEKRMVLFLIGTALLITLVVEFRYVQGDIGRMNTIFKFYMQSWLLFAVCAAAAFGWLLAAFPQWSAGWRNSFQGGLSLLAIGVFMFTLTATVDKIRDRMTPAAPRTLDSMDYMNYSQHWDGNMMDLSEDYHGIRWMQDNVPGSPVIVEANCTEYRWCTRYTIYTGLPGVLGWNWHQRQQRALIPPTLITDRVTEIDLFYTSPDVQSALAFLKKHDVKYIVVGQLERNVYPVFDGVDGLAKFEQYNGTYWRSVYRDLNTVIYEVLP